jgi:hypothetical protein
MKKIHVAFPVVIALAMASFVVIVLDFPPWNILDYAHIVAPGSHDQGETFEVMLVLSYIGCFVAAMALGLLSLWTSAPDSPRIRRTKLLLSILCLISPVMFLGINHFVQLAFNPPNMLDASFHALYGIPVGLTILTFLSIIAWNPTYGRRIKILFGFVMTILAASTFVWTYGASLLGIADYPLM